MRRATAGEGEGMSSQGLRIAVTGATGNVGTRVLEALQQDDSVESVVGISRRGSDWVLPKVERVRADITSDDLDELFAGCDRVIHLAWLIQPSRDPLLTWRNNVLGTERVLRAVRRGGVTSLVYASSVGAYAPRKGAGRVDESWPTHGWPAASYTREKAYVERMCDVFERENPHINVCRVRTGFIFQRESASQQRRLFAGPFLPHTLVRPRMALGVPWVPGLRLQVVHAVDAARAYNLAARSAASGAFNIATEPYLDGAVAARALRGRQLPVPYGLARAAVAAAWHAHAVPASPALFDAAMHLPIMDTARARHELDWTPGYSTEEVLREFMEGMSDAAAFPTPPLRRHQPGGRAGELATGVGARP